MNISTFPARALACLLAGACVQAAAQTGRPDAADPHASVPATVYRPALDYRGEAPPSASPDRDWQASNATVAAYNPMMLTMKPRAGQDAGAARHDAHAGHRMQEAAPPPAQPATEAAPAGHAHHHDHGEGR